MQKHQKLQLILEKEGPVIWGRVLINENLFIDSANSLKALEAKLRKSLKQFEGLGQVEFEYAYDLTIFFEQFNFLNQSKLAELAGINPGLLRQYSSGHKQPSREQVARIQKAVRHLAARLKTVQLSTKSYA